MPSFITRTGTYLPGAPIANDEMEEYLGCIDGQPSKLRKRVLAQNGIQQRHYALDRAQRVTHSTAQMAAAAIHNAQPVGADFLATATSQGDLPLPGFASMVHGAMGPQAGVLELASFHGVCASGLAAIKAAHLQVCADGKQQAIACAAEQPSRMFVARRFNEACLLRGLQSQGSSTARAALPADVEFLRWMLSDGAGAAVISDVPSSHRPNLRIDWVDLRSYAHELPVCMWAGGERSENGDIQRSWLDYPTVGAAARAGVIDLHQDLRLVGKIVELGLAHYADLVAEKRVEPQAIKHMLCHFSSKCFYTQVQNALGSNAPKNAQWAETLYRTGNTGSASLFFMLDALMRRTDLTPGEKVLCMVPESGRFTTGFMSLTVC